MALINCPECGKEISDKALSCPNCGTPINMQFEIPVVFQNPKAVSNSIGVICEVTVDGLYAGNFFGDQGLKTHLLPGSHHVQFFTPPSGFTTFASFDVPEYANEVTVLVVSDFWGWKVKDVIVK